MGPTVRDALIIRLEPVFILIFFFSKRFLRMEDQEKREGERPRNNDE